MGVQRSDDYIRPRGYYDNQGNLLTVNFNTLNLLSGLTASATTLNNTTDSVGSLELLIYLGV